MKLLKEKSICKINEFGNKYWFNKGKSLHRDNGPAIELISGGKHWYQNGKLHRDNGPAIESIDGHKLWYKNDKLHREDGPAIKYADGIKSWFLNGIKYTEEEFNKLTRK